MSAQTKFFKALWGTTTACRSIWYGLHGQPPHHQKWFSSTEAALTFANGLSGQKKYNVYHACSLFKTERRSKDSLEKINAIWIDIDLKDTPFTTLKEMATVYLPRFKKSLFGTGFWVISSGNGLHLYWTFDKSVSRPRWLKIAQRLHDTCHALDITIDPARTRDSSSIMRFPGSFNLKSKIKPVVILKEGSLLELAPILEKFKSDAPKNVKYTKSDFEANQEAAKLNSSPRDAKAILERCGFLREFSRSGFAGNEPAWHHSIGLLWRCEGGAKIAHKYSAKAKEYNEAVTQTKLDRIIKEEIAPPTCSFLSQFGYCVHCEHKKKITTPLQLGIKVTPITTVDDIDDIKLKERAEELMELVPKHGWQIGKEGIYKTIDDIPVMMCDIPFYIIDLICEDFFDDTLLTVLIRAFPKGTKSIEFKLPLRILSEIKKAQGEFYARGVFPKHQKLLLEYLTSYVKNIQHVPPHISINSLGWQVEGSFAYTASGTALTEGNKIVSFVTDKKMRGYCEGFKQKGELVKWHEAFNYLNTLEYYPHLFSVLCSLGAPLLMHTAAKGFILSLQGQSGTGKTLAHKFALSVWGDPARAGVLGTRDTHTAMLGRIATVKNLPLRLDEATTINAQKLSGLIYELVNGRGRSRATIDGSLSNTSAEWQTMTLITTNRPLLENNVTLISEAERCRILELGVEMPPKMVEIGKSIGSLMEQNYGLLGPLFLKEIMLNRETILEKLDGFYARFQNLVSADKRFWTTCGAIAFTAATVAVEKGFLTLDIDAHLQWFENLLQQQSCLNKEYLIESRGFETRQEFILALKDHLTGNILVLDHTGLIIREPHQEVKGRVIIDEKKKRTLYVRTNVFNDFIKLHYVQGTIEVRKNLGIGAPKTQRFGRTIVKCYAFEF